MHNYKIQGNRLWLGISTSDTVDDSKQGENLKKRREIAERRDAACERMETKVGVILGYVVVCIVGYRGCHVAVFTKSDCSPVGNLWPFETSRRWTSDSRTM